jgi:predicted nucleic acid-binding protein
MIVVDTNVLSKEMKPVPAAPVYAWFRRQKALDLFATAVCEAEILVGAAILPIGQRKRDLEIAARDVLVTTSMPRSLRLRACEA